MIRMDGTAGDPGPLGAFRGMVRTFPVQTAVLTALVFGASLYLNALLMPVLPGGPAGAVLLELIWIVWPLAIALLCGYGWIYREGGLLRTLAAGGFFLVMEGGLLISVLLGILSRGADGMPDPGTVIGGALSLFGVGFREETVFRGVIAGLLADAWARDRRGVWGTVLLSGVLFGGTHLWNIAMGVSPKSAVIQSLAACGVGWALCAVYLRGGSLWAMMLLHALTDAASLSYFYIEGAGERTGDVVVDAVNELGPSNLVPLLTFTLLTVFLLRGRSWEGIVRRVRERKERSVS